MPHIKYSDSQVSDYLAEYFQFLKDRFSKFGPFLPTRDDLNTFDAEKLSELYSYIMKECALTSNPNRDKNSGLQEKKGILSFKDCALIPENKKEAFEEAINKSSVEECNLFLRGMTFEEAPHKNERSVMLTHSETKEHAVKHFKDSLNMLNARKERTNFFGRKVKNSDEFTAVMDALEKLNNAPYNDNNEEVENAKKACEAYIASHKNPLSTIGRERLQIIKSLDDRLSLSMEEVKEVEEAKKTWTRDDVSVDPQRVDKYAKMIMLTNDVRLENIMDTSKDQTYANACLQASNLLKDAYLKNDTKELDALKEKCAFAIAKKVDSFEESLFRNNEDYKKMGKDFKTEGKAFLDDMVGTLKNEGYTNENTLTELTSKVDDLDKVKYNESFLSILPNEVDKTVEQLKSVLSKDRDFETYSKKIMMFLKDGDNSVESAQFRLDTQDERMLKEDVGRMTAYAILRHEAYSVNPNMDLVKKLLDNPDGTLETFATSDFGKVYLEDTKKLSELANMGSDEIYKSAKEQSSSIRSNTYTNALGTNQEIHEAKVEADKKAENERKRAEQEILDYKKLKEEEEKAEYNLKTAEAANKWGEKNLGKENIVTKTMSEHVKNRKKELDMIYEKNKDKIKPSSDFEKSGF